MNLPAKRVDPLKVEWLNLHYTWPDLEYNFSGQAAFSAMCSTLIRWSSVNRPFRVYGHHWLKIASYDNR